MVTLKAMVRYARADGMYAVYIRVLHNSKPGYIKTDKVVDEKGLSKKKEILDPVVNEYCARKINRFMQKMNKVDYSSWSINEIIEYLTREDVNESFSDYARAHIDHLINTGHARTAANYRYALNHFERYMGSNQILFAQMTSAVLTSWIHSLRQTNRAKEMYPVCLRQVFKKALLELNDEEKDIIRIKFNPWLKVTIPKQDKGRKRAISAEACREFFNRPLPKTKMLSPLPKFGRDVALLSLCLGGMNTVDLYNLKKSNYRNGIINYKRAKTRNHRQDEAYMEMRVEPFIQPIFEKYLAPEDDEFLFMFHTRYCDSDSFCANVNSGIKKICNDMGMEREDYYCAYTFRHTWATIAQNDCDASIHEVAFGLNHSFGMTVTRGYVKIDFSPAWELNRKVIDFIFYSEEKSKQGKARDIEERQEKLFRISKKMMIYARAYFKGKILAEITDIGFDNVQQVLDTIVPKLPQDLPQGCMVQFRLTNCDLDVEVVYERTKGKGF